MCVLALIAFSMSASDMLVGGFREMDLNDEKLPELMSFALASFNKDQLQLHPGVKYESPILTRAESQVVAGVNYRLHFTAIESGDCADTCLKRECVAVIYDVSL